MSFIPQNVDNHAHRTPKFGPLQGVKVVFSAVQTAGPFGPHMMAEWGADVVWLESVKGGGDPIRGYRQAEHEHRNDRSMALNIFTPEGMEIFKKLMLDADIFLTSGKGPSFANRGITDEFLWSINPKLVIVRISGYGQDAHPHYLNRACLDGIAQAFTGFMSQNGMPDGGPIPAYPYVGDYYTAMFSLSSALAALIRARETGVGECVDLTMYEALLRMEAFNLIDYLNDGKLYPRPGDRDPIQLAVGVYKTKDGFMLMNVLGQAQLKSFFKLIGLEYLYGTEEYPETMAVISPETSQAELISQKIDAYMLSKSTAEHEEIFEKLNVAYSPVLTFDQLPDHPQYVYRGDFVEWETMDGEIYKGTNIFPRFKMNPARIWRAMPTQGYDTDVILEDLGYSQTDIEALHQKGIVLKT